MFFSWDARHLQFNAFKACTVKVVSDDIDTDIHTIVSYASNRLLLIFALFQNRMWQIGSALLESVALDYSF